MLRILLMPIIVFALFVATVARAQTTTTSLAGIGESTARPVGAWRLPDGVELVRPITGYSIFYAEDCAPPEEAQGVGEMVQVCLSLRHTGQRNGVPFQLPIEVVIPANLIFISDDETIQNGILIRRVIREIKPGETIHIPVNAMCLNVSRSGSQPGATFVLGPVLDRPEFNALVARLENKRISPEAVAQLQMAFWELTKGKPLSRESNAVIDSLPAV